jgi:hypothetical protein
MTTHHDGFPFSPVSRLSRWLVPFAAAIVGACAGSGGDDSPAPSGDGDVHFHGEQQPLAGFDFDTGKQPAVGPVQIDLALKAKSSLVVDAAATASGSSSAPVLAGEPGSGQVTMDVHFVLAGTLSVDLPGLPKYDGPIPNMNGVDLAFGGKTTFDPFLIGGKATTTATLPETKLPAIPLPGGIPGELQLTIVEGSTVSTDFTGTCAAISTGANGDAPHAHYVGKTTTSANLQIAPTIVIHMPIGGDKSIAIPAIAIPVSGIVAPIDLGDVVVTLGQSSSSGSKAKIGTCGTVPDAGPGDDGSIDDTSTSDDTGVEDSGTSGSHDSGTVTDSTSSSDAGSSVDSGSGVDTGHAPDAVADSACTCGDHVCRASCENATTCATDCGELVFDIDDARRTTTTGDWAIGDWKAECNTSEAMQGLSASCFGLFCGVHSALCTADDSTKFSHASCHVLDFSGSDARSVTFTGDWASGLYKGECALDEYVSGYARDPSGRVSKILCCGGAHLEHLGCVTQDLYGGDARESTSEGDWSPGFNKAECAPGRYVAGIASSEVSGTRAILCCSP